MPARVNRKSDRASDLREPGRPRPARPAGGTIECRRPPEWYNRAPNAGQLLAQPDIGRTSGIHSGRARPSRMIGGR